MEIEEKIKYEINQSSAILKRDEVSRIKQSRIERTDMVCKLLPDISPGYALDVGCEWGVCMEKLQSIGWSVQGIDINPIGKKYNPNLKIQQWDLNKGKIPFPKSAFDLVICTEVLVHIFYPNFILKEIRRILKKSGFAIISMPNAYNIQIILHILLRKNIGAYAVYNCSHQRRYYFLNLNQIRQFISSEFRIVKEEFGWVKSRPFNLIPKFIKKLAPSYFAGFLMMLLK